MNKMLRDPKNISFSRAHIFFDGRSATYFDCSVSNPTKTFFIVYDWDGIKEKVIYEVFEFVDSIQTDFYKEFSDKISLIKYFKEEQKIDLKPHDLEE